MVMGLQYVASVSFITYFVWDRSRIKDFNFMDNFSMGWNKAHTFGDSTSKIWFWISWKVLLISNILPQTKTAAESKTFQVLRFKVCVANIMNS